MKLVDSDILIAHLRGVTAARDWLADARVGHFPMYPDLEKPFEL
jgi:hypothetical protein